MAQIYRSIFDEKMSFFLFNKNTEEQGFAEERKHQSRENDACKAGNPLSQ